MKKPRIDAFIEPQKVKSLASPLDDMPAIRPPQTEQAPVEATASRSLEPPPTPPAESADRPLDAADTPAAPATEPNADLSEMPYRKHSCLLTPAEFNALDELKVALRKRYNGTITKENLTRCAIRYMLDDYQANGDESPVLTPLKKLVKEW